MNHYRCVTCHEGGLRLSAAKGSLKCDQCDAEYELRYGILKSVVKEPPETFYNELSYARKCLGMVGMDWDKFCILEEKRQRKFNKRIIAERLNFDAVIESVKTELPNKADVLQLCCRDSLHYLDWFKANGHNTWGCDPYIHIGETWDDFGSFENPRFSVADFGNLPYHSNSFDVLVLSHALFHCEDLVKGCQEIWRVLKPGGILILLNEPLRGVLTPTVKYDNVLIMPHPREKRYFAKDYMEALTGAGFHEMQLFFPEYQHQQLKLNRVNPFTFKVLSLVLRPFWRIPKAQKFLRQKMIGLAYVMIGFPLQLVTRKMVGHVGKGKKIIPPPETPNTLKSRLPQRGDVGERRGNEQRGTDRRKR